MSQKQSLPQRILQLIITAVTGRLERQIKEAQKRLIRTLTLVFVSLAFFAIGMAYLTTSLAKFLEAYFGLFALAMMGLIFILIGLVIILLARPRS